MNTALEELQTRIEGLSALIDRRVSQASIVDAPRAHARYTSPHIAAACKELHDLTVDFITLKIQRGDWDPVAVMNRMTSGPAPVVAAPAPTPESPAPTVVHVDETRERLTALLGEHSGNFLPRSLLKDLIT